MVIPGNKQDKNKLNERQKKFVDFYIQTNNISESARKAGYEEKNAPQTGFCLLKNPKIQKAINARLEQLENERTATTQEILEYLASVMRGEGIGKGFTQPEKVKARVTAKDRNKAAEMLAKCKGMFINKTELDVQGSLPVVIRDDF